MTLPSRFAAPAAASASSDTPPPVALMISSACTVAPSKVASSTWGFSACHAEKAGGPEPSSGAVRASVASGSRVPTVTWWPSAANLPARV